jgi:hypothetical protein
MLACKQVANALSQGDYENLPPFRKAMLKVHVKLCVMCGKYHRDVMDMQDGVRKFRHQEDAGVLEHTPALSEDSKRRMLSAIHDAGGSSSTASS